MNIFSTIFNSVLYQPMLNFLVLVYIYTNNFGVAVIGLTLLIKILIHPLNKKALESQKAMAEIQPRIQEIQRKHKDDQQKQAEEMLALYRDKKFNPFSGIFLLFLQIPIIWALFYVFKGGIAINPALIYPFVSLPEHINPYFLGLDLSKPNMILAAITAVAQYFQAKTATPPAAQTGTKDRATEISEMVTKQMVFLIPLITFFVLYALPSALGLYWLVTTAFSIFEQRALFKKKQP